jgi:hypothetical protein
VCVKMRTPCAPVPTFLAGMLFAASREPNDSAANDPVPSMS